jgi:hypothetical protein
MQWVSMDCVDGKDGDRGSKRVERTTMDLVLALLAHEYWRGHVCARDNDESSTSLNDYNASTDHRKPGLC